MSFEVQGRGGAQREATGAGPSTRVGIPTVNRVNNEAAVYYDIDPPSCWRRFRVFLKGVIFGFTVVFCCPAVKLTSDDLTWGLRPSVIGRMLGGMVGGGVVSVGSIYLGCWAGGEIAKSVGDDDDDGTGCSVGIWSCVAFGLCFMVLAILRTIPKALFRTSKTTVTKNDDPETKPYENK